MLISMLVAILIAILVSILVAISMLVTMIAVIALVVIALMITMGIKPWTVVATGAAVATSSWWIGSVRTGGSISVDYSAGIFRVMNGWFYLRRRGGAVVSQCLLIDIRHLPGALLGLGIVPILATALSGVFFPWLIGKSTLSRTHEVFGFCPLCGLGDGIVVVDATVRALIFLPRVWWLAKMAIDAIHHDDNDDDDRL